MRATRIGSLSEAVAIVMISLVFLLVSFEVGMRYLFSSPMRWSGELARFSFVWATYLGAAGVMSRDAHVRVEIIESFVGPRGMMALRVLGHILVLLASLACLAGAWMHLQVAGGARSPGAQWPMWTLHASALAGFGLLASEAIVLLIKDMRGQGRSTDGIQDFAA